MASAKEVMQGGLSAGTARALGGQYVTVAAAGSTITDATAVTASMCVVTAANGTTGVSISGEIGDEVWLFNNAGSTLKVWPESTAAIAVAGTGLGTAAAAFSQLTYKTTMYKKVTTTQWLAITSA
jgi:hypothetical protein